jgi:hypothetical protein
MFWGNKSAKEKEKKEKLSGPIQIPVSVQNYLVAERKWDSDLVKLLKAVIHKSETGESPLHIRIFDNSDAIAKKVQVNDYASLDEHPDLMIYEGWFDERSKQVKLEEKKGVSWDTPIFTTAEIQQKIEALKEPASTVFFYMARGVTSGGPLGMGAAVVELNPNYPDKKQKKYIVYSADVIDMRPAGTRQRLFDLDKPKQIANWIKNGHHKRIY